MRLVKCKTCGLERIYGSKDICNSCLYKKINNKEETRQTQRDRKRKAYIIRKGLPKDHVFKERKTHCITCNEEIDNEKRISKEFCNICYKRQYHKNNPQVREREKKKYNIRTRFGIVG